MSGEWIEILNRLILCEQQLEALRAEVRAQEERLRQAEQAARLLTGGVS